MVSADTEEIGDKHMGEPMLLSVGIPRILQHHCSEYGQCCLSLISDDLRTLVRMSLSVATLSTPLCKVSSIEKSVSLDDLEDIEKAFLHRIEEEFED